MVRKFPTFQQSEEGYNNLYNTMKFTRSAAINTAAKKIINNKNRYISIQNKTGVPWYFIGALHMREANNDFRGILHNGERIIGTGRKTTLMPNGRGPFNTWEEAAIDSIKYQGLDKIFPWSVARMAYEGEKYNGIGYFLHVVNSPYLWGGTNHQQSGKYIADGVWDSTAVDKQLGIMPVIYRIRELEKISDTKTKEQNKNETVNEIKEKEVKKEGLLIKLLRFLFVKK